MTTHPDQPGWWTTHEASAWGRAKEALRRDWEQTKYDFGLEFGQDLHQELKDTVRQVVGSEPIPPPHVANATDAWSDEAAVRYGYGAGLSPNYRDYSSWSHDLESQLKKDWEAMDSHRPWEDVRMAVRYGWTRSPRTAD
jgi:hypothetical protein